MDTPAAPPPDISFLVQTHPLDRSLSSPDAHAIDYPAMAPESTDFKSLQAQEVAGAQPASAVDAFLTFGSGDAMCSTCDLSESSLLPSAPCSSLILAHNGSSLHPPRLELLPNEILLHVLGFLDVNDLLATSRFLKDFFMKVIKCHSLVAAGSLHTTSLDKYLLPILAERISLSPILHQNRLRYYRIILPPLLYSPSRPSLTDLIARSILLTSTSVVSKRLARSLVSIRLSRRLAVRPSPEALVSRAVLPPECVPGLAGVLVAPGLVATRKAIEKERLKDGLRRWMAGKWRREVSERQEHVRRADESRGVGRVWRLTKFWERVSRGESMSW
ncbi:hypothetical protein HJFPF1_10026 [Paramyrothecium foliicola]|nr:hypothetical protein HJFPF1_10026 [Paramyrothecium foliicola]